LHGAPADGPFALLDFPDHANVGDSAIWLGTVNYFRTRRGRAPAYVASIRSFSEAALRAAVPEGPIFIHGGGNFGDVWPGHQEFREMLLRRFPDRDIIQLPQSLHFERSAGIGRTGWAIARHGRFRLFVRDRWSYDFATSHFDCEVTLCPDMALFLDPLERGAPEVDVLYLLRTDHERSVGEPSRRSEYRSRTADWLHESRLALRLGRWRAVLGEAGRGRRVTPRRLRAAAYDGAARARVARGCALLSSGRVVITDRLHAHLLCYLLGIPHAVLDNSYCKLRRFVDLWFPEDAPYRADTLEKAERWAADAVAG
jgi:exopolysaccharide biosynthesis predicted pyruvyltransferase EpsI